VSPLPLALSLAAWLPAAPPAGAVDLAAIAAYGPRSPSCLAAVRGSVWFRARATAEAAYCAALAQGYARLLRRPEEALERAAAAERARPGRAGPPLLAGRALLALDRPEEAAERFARALDLDGRCASAPDALHDVALASLLTGRLEGARAAYRALVPRVDLLADDARARRVLVEAAGAVMTEGVASLDEAVSYLGEARRRFRGPGQRALVLGALGRALSRQGRQDQARGVVADADGALLTTDPSALAPPGTGGRARTEPALPPGELHAVAAVLAEGEQRAEAIDQWRAYIAAVGEQGTWVEHARGRLAALERGY